MASKNIYTIVAVLFFIAQAILFVIGGWTAFFGVTCYFGGPDPRPGDFRDHLIFGTLWTAVGIGIIVGGWKSGQFARKLWNKSHEDSYEA